VFSPYYAWSGRERPENHCALNVALYGPGCQRWAMTERGDGAVSREARQLVIGPSDLTWDGDALTIRIDEFTAPVPPLPMSPSPLRGTIRVTPTALNLRPFPLDAEGRHVWQPIAPRAAIEVTLDEPSLSWRGEGYIDTNSGTEPLEDAFADWDWSRAHLWSDTVVLYDLKRRDGTDLTLALRFDAAGGLEEVEPPPPAVMPSTACWRMPRRSRADAGERVAVRHTWEDSPFYARSAISTRLYGEPATACTRRCRSAGCAHPWCAPSCRSACRARSAEAAASSRRLSRRSDQSSQAHQASTTPCRPTISMKNNVFALMPPPRAPRPLAADPARARPGR
jgi:carotenoid 1,2-hydratase